MNRPLAEELMDYISACFAGVWIQSHENSEATIEIGRLCRDQDWDFSTWDVCNGVLVGGTSPLDNESGSDPLAAIKAFEAASDREKPSLLILKNFHRFLGNMEIVQTLAEQILSGKHSRNFYIVLSPKTEIPIELEKLIVVLDHSLPDRDQLAEIARGICDEDELSTGEEFERVLDAASGLTRLESENAFALSLIRDGQIAAPTVQALKSQTLKKSGLLAMHESPTGFENLGGMEAVKEFCKKILGSSSKRVRPKGILLLGVPGVGKSAFAKALGKEVGRPTLVMDVGRLMGGLVGQTEENVRRALEVVDKMEPAILFIDELEKALSGSGGGGRSDSGVSTRMLGAVLTWLADHESDIFTIATSNANMPTREIEFRQLFCICQDIRQTCAFATSSPYRKSAESYWVQPRWNLFVVYGMERAKHERVSK